MPLVAVCRDVEAAAVMLRAGALIVLCCPDAAALGDTVATLRGGSPSGHRLAGLVGDLGEPETEAAGRAMARELFGGEPVVVRTTGAARHLASQKAQTAAAAAVPAPASEESETGSVPGPMPPRSDTV